MVKAQLCVLVFIVTVFLAAGCKKDDDSPSTGNGGGGSPLMDHIHLAVDSACVQAPNVFTPNADGINDVFYLLARNTVSVQLAIDNAAGTRVFTSSDPTESWSPSGDGGPYRVSVNATSISGVNLQGTSMLHVLSYDNGACLAFGGTPVCGDQLDPRICGVTYPTNEVFCP